MNRNIETLIKEYDQIVEGGKTRTNIIYVDDILKMYNYVFEQLGIEKR